MGAPRRIDIRLQRPEQLFSADPVSPMSPDYTEYTAQPALDTVRDLVMRRSPGRADDVTLVVSLPPAAVHEGLAAELEAGVRRWLTVQNRIDIDLSDANGAVGRRLFWAGLASFLVLQFLRLTLVRWSGPIDDEVVEAVSEGLSVTSWVMLWVPVQIFTVEVWRDRIRRKRMRALERMRVEVVELR